MSKAKLQTQESDLLKNAWKSISHNNNQFRILIVDDNHYDAELLAYHLDKSKLKFITKMVNGKLPYEKELKTFNPDVIYCDFNIAPDFNAVDAIRILRDNLENVPFVLVTGALNEEVASICINEKMDDYVLKSNLERIPLSLINSLYKRQTELQKKEAHEKLIQSEKQIRNFAVHQNSMIEEERARISREIHDELCQQLISIKLDISAIRKDAGISEKVKNRVDKMWQMADEAIHSSRRIATELRPGILDTLGLCPSIEWLASEFEKKSEVKCGTHLDIPEEAVSKEHATCFFRVCQEALSNVLKHSGANEVSIKLKKEGQKIIMTIIDNGKGFQVDKKQNPFSMGLVGMEERAKIIGADLNIVSKTNSGTTISLEYKNNS